VRLTIQITLFYLAMALEMVIFGAQTYQGKHVATLSHQVVERYAALTLIILWVVVVCALKTQGRRFHFAHQGVQAYPCWPFDT
jgi:hypothetical protein